jgi:protein phosphatase 2C family protein 2/3
LNSQQVVDYVRRGIAERKDLDELAEKLMDRCLAPDSDWGGIGCDNMTVLIVALLNGRTKAEWYDWMSERVEKGIGYRTPDDVVDPFKNGRPAGGLGGFRSGGMARGGGGLPGTLASALTGNVVFRPSEDDDEAFDHRVVYPDDSSDDEEEEEEGENKAKIQDITMEDESSSTPTSTTRNDEIAHPAVRSEGYLDQSEDPTRTST